MSASMRPDASSAGCAIAVAEAAFATSSLAQTAVPFSACTRSSVCAQSLTSASTTRAPRPARYRANSRPMPRAAPVITTTFPSTFIRLQLRPHDCQRRHVHLHAPLGEIVGGLDRGAVGHLGHTQAVALQESGEQEIERAGDTRPIELAGLRARAKCAP